MRFPSLFNVIPQGEVALVTHPSGKQNKVVGPARIFASNTFELFDRIVLNQNQRGTLIDETGKFQHMQGPRVVHVHPDGSFVHDTMYQLAGHEAMVVIGADGKYRIVKGDTTATVWLNTEEKLHVFKWSGSRGETDFKTPGALQINKLRLQDTQTYVGYQIRTKDNLVVSVHLMLSYRYVAIEALLENDDPLGVMFNRIMAEITSHVAALTFDEFKDGTESKVCNIPLFNADKEWFKTIGIELNHVSLREWRPTDQKVQSVLELAATANAQKAVDSANHDRAMIKIANDEAVLDRERMLDEKRLEAAKARGKAEGDELAAFYGALDQTGQASVLTALKVASKASTLCLPPELLAAKSKAK